VAADRHEADRALLVLVEFAGREQLQRVGLGLEPGRQDVSVERVLRVVEQDDSCFQNHDNNLIN